MALRQSQQIPKDAVALDEIEATNYVWDIVTKWESLSDTWALRYAPMAMGGASAISGIIINDHYRKKLKLGNFGFFSSVIPISLMPGLMTALFHRHVDKNMIFGGNTVSSRYTYAGQIVSTNMLLMKNEACPVCFEIKAAVIQWGFGVAYPMVLGPTSALMFANRYSTYRVPNLAAPKALFEFLAKITRSLQPTLVYIGAFQLVLSSVLTYYEMKNHISIRRKILEIEDRVLVEHGLS